MSELYSLPYLPYVLTGNLTRDFIISRGGKALNNIIGGGLFYTAAGIYLWEHQIGLISRIGSNYPAEWIQKLHNFGIDTRGIKNIGYPLEQRQFISGISETFDEQHIPLANYAKAGLPYPKELLGYSLPLETLGSKTKRSEETIIFRDIPRDYFEANFIHFCPMDFLTHNLIPQSFRQHGNKTITLSPGSTYMAPNFWREMPALVNSLSAFITSEDLVRNLFVDQRMDQLPEMMKIISGWGAQNVAILCRDRTTLLLVSEHQDLYTIPPYSETVVNLTGSLDAFCGGFLYGLSKAYDPVKALAYGSTAASIVEGISSPWFALDVMEGLAEARRSAQETKIQKISSK